MKQKKPEKIKLIIFPGNYVPHIGGLETHVQKFSEHYSKYADITIFTPMVKGALEKETHKTNNGQIKIIRYPAFEAINQYYAPKFWSSKFWKLYFELRKQKFDWAMTRTLFFANSTLGLMFAKCRIKKINLIHVEHGSDYPQNKNLLIKMISRAYLFVFGNIHARCSNALVGVSNGAKDFLEKNFWLKKNADVKVIRRGFDLQALNVKPLKLEKNSIVYVGRISEAKGIQDLINATMNEKYSLYIIGEGAYQKKLERIAEKSKSKIIFTGKLEHSKVIQYLKGASLFVNPSYTEGLPTSVLDALFAGCKVIATDVGGTKEILGEKWDSKGYRLIQPRKPEQLKKAIQEVLKEKKDALQEYKKLFDWEKHAEQYNKIMK